MTKINIFSGFLGAGKTTLIKKLITEAFHDKMVLIENEFGEISVDGGFMKDAGIEIREMNSGCICCSLVGDFEASLRKVMETYNPDRIIIEPSGVGKLSDVRKAVEKVCDENVQIEGSIAVVHAGKCKMYAKNFGEFFIDQIECADCVVLSRTQDVKEKKMAETMEIIREHNPKAPIVTTPWDEINGEQILEAMHHSELLNMEEAVHEHCHHHHDHNHQDIEEALHDHNHHHYHEDGEECCCHMHEYHVHEECDDPECSCHDHEHHHHHHHDEECCHDHEHHHHHDEECCHDHEHHHHHDHECDDPNCSCHDHEHHHHHHDHECTDPNCSCHDHHHHHADDVFVSWGKETTQEYTKEQLEHILAELLHADEYGMVLRAKGIVKGQAGEWFHFNYVPGEGSVEVGAADYTGRYCVIGSKLDEEALEELFACKD